ncbi:MAG: wax ester/triacylglycerol synthase family O-acyltransferase [Acidimicrobiia bacterium]
MEQLAPLDARFLYQETPSIHMHTLKVAIVDPSNVPGGYSFDVFRRVIAERLHLLPPFRRRIVELPLGMHHPVWIEDPAFDLDRHVRYVRAEEPGGEAELETIVSEIAGTPLDRRRPLWEITMVDGLASGKLAFVAKIHHSVADGVAAAALLANVLETDPEPSKAPRPPEPWRGEPVPGRIELVLLALREWMRLLLGLPRLIARTATGMFNQRRRKRHAAVRAPLPFEGPRTRFNTTATPNRTFATTSVPLEDLRRVKRAFGVTLNDVFLAMVGGALRAYLLEHGELPARSLVASVPMSSGLDEPGRLSGNRVVNLSTRLRTDLADPIARVYSIHEVTSLAKDLKESMGRDVFSEWSSFTPPRLFAWTVRSWGRTGLSDRVRPPMNLIVSNVRGPGEPLFVTGGRLERIYSVGPILDGIGLNITAWSYVDTLDIALIACPDRVPDLPHLAALLPPALEELRGAAQAVGRIRA